MPSRATMTEIETLERRYRRFIRFDRWLSIAYGATALIPLYSLGAIGRETLFHVTGALAIASVGGLGWFIDTKLLQNSLRSEAPGYGITLSFVISRLGLGLWGISILNSSWRGAPGGELSADLLFHSLLNVMFAPPIFGLLVIAAFYRLIYHIWFIFS